MLLPNHPFFLQPPPPSPSVCRIVMSGSHVIPRLFGSVFFAGKFTRFAAAAESVAPPSMLRPRHDTGCDQFRLRAKTTANEVN